MLGAYRITVVGAGVLLKWEASLKISGFRDVKTLEQGMMPRPAREHLLCAE